MHTPVMPEDARTMTGRELMDAIAKERERERLRIRPPLPWVPILCAIIAFLFGLLIARL